MQFNRGDRVKFLNDIGGGIITRIRDSKIVIVETQDGFEIPVPLSELILVEKSKDQDRSDTGSVKKADNRKESTGKQNMEDELIVNIQAIDEPEEDNSGLMERNLLLALSGNERSGELEAWLINDSGLNVLYVMLLKQDDLYTNIKTGLIEADTKIFIANITREQINSFISLRLQAVFFRKGTYDPVSPSQMEYALDPAEIFAAGSFVINDFFDEKAKIIPMISDARERELKLISEQEISLLINKDSKISKPPVSGKRVNSDPLFEEVDLHIGELIDNHEGLSGREVLDIQMARFTTALEGAIRGNTKKVVFIHGIGNGKLKFEIRKTLDKKYPKLVYQDASFQEYGYGATMVIVRR
ncbi:MAG: DUF2027 domain-containing protein [Bacteroidales bacterium]